MVFLPILGREIEERLNNAKTVGRIDQIRGIPTEYVEIKFKKNRPLGSEREIRLSSVISLWRHRKSKDSAIDTGTFG